MCVQHTHNLELIKELLGFFLVANDETRKNVTCLIKEAITSTIKIKDEQLVIGLLEFLQTDKKIKTLTDTSELTEDAVFAATVEQNSGTFNFYYGFRKLNDLNSLIGQLNTLVNLLLN